jgi:hypothetical protein
LADEAFAAVEDVWPDDADGADVDAAFVAVAVDEVVVDGVAVDEVVVDGVAVDEVIVDEVVVDETDTGEADDDDAGEDEAGDEAAAEEDAVVLLLLLAVPLALLVALGCEDALAEELLAGVELFGVLAAAVLTVEVAAFCSFVAAAVFADEADSEELPTCRDALSLPPSFSITSTQMWSSRYGSEKSPSLKSSRSSFWWLPVLSIAQSTGPFQLSLFPSNMFSLNRTASSAASRRV